MSPDPNPISPPLPDRPIAPLPKRRLRERLPPELAESIKYPAVKEPPPSLFNYPYPTREDYGPAPDSSQLHDGANRYGSRRDGAARVDSDDEESGAEKPYGYAAPASLDIAGRAGRTKGDQPRHASLPRMPLSTASSADGYDSFENTNNKKKRKIPTAGDSSPSVGHLGGDSGSVSSSSGSTHAGAEKTAVLVHYGVGGSTSQGISGPGRGRFGRARNGRSPLRSLGDVNSMATGRSKGRLPQWPPYSGPTGIISNAIANAEKLPPPRHGQENISLLEQHTSAATKTTPTPTSTQFTFTCDSQVSGTIRWPGTDPGQLRYPLGYRPRPNSMSAPGGPAPGGAASIGHQDAATSTPRIKKKGRAGTREDRELRRAERDRYRQAQAAYRKNPPKDEDFYLCEFCEYERIFGEPPRALIRQYEIKEREQKKQADERKRLLAKAKSRSRKGKKIGKSQAKNGQVDNHGHAHGLDGLGNISQNMQQDYSHSSQSVEYDDYHEHEDIYDEPEHLGEQGRVPWSPTDTAEFDDITSSKRVPDTAMRPGARGAGGGGGVGHVRAKATAGAT